ncbi:MAG: ATP synthase F1 subunit delta [Deltaproteobacteria bacterium]|nr:ATP synthase F1 subunit delta [Deltaproteobacteria bacterium]MCW5803845.1 ATP synthase F1 subunit delta [Deltaproteobacteria bacterium]
MLTGSLARRYARAIFEIGTAKGNLDKIGTDLRTLGAAMKLSEELVGVLTNPAIRRADRRKIVDALLARVSAAPETRSTVYLLLDGERLASLPAIAREVDAMIEARAGRVTAEITSARPLDAAQLTQITAALEKLSGKKIVVEKKEDPELLGGVVAKLGDVVYDGSLRTQLRALRDELTK